MSIMSHIGTRGAGVGVGVGVGVGAGACCRVTLVDAMFGAVGTVIGDAVSC
jgi:hypothetical protein